MRFNSYTTGYHWSSIKGCREQQWHSPRQRTEKDRETEVSTACFHLFGWRSVRQDEGQAESRVRVFNSPVVRVAVVCWARKADRRRGLLMSLDSVDIPSGGWWEWTRSQDRGQAHLCRTTCPPWLRQAYRAGLEQSRYYGQSFSI